VTTDAPSLRPAWLRRGAAWITVAVPALIAYVPLLLTKPGIVGADTKTYLYLDPWKLLRSTPYVWDSQIGLGTITHQNIGYLFPMGPFYLLFDQLGLPDWVAQRLWLGTIMFVAALGVRYLLQTLGWPDEPGRRGGLVVASLAYMLSPYLLQYEARISVILLPWTALPWLIALTAKALRHGGWRYPAWFAVVVLFVGGINATALILVGVGPLLWVLYAVAIEREVSARRAVAAVGRIGALTVLTSLWWLAGLWAEGRFGLPVLRYTESYRTVATVSQAPEVLRGLGYWFFYGRDKAGPWIEPSVEYTNRTLLLALSYAIPTLALASAALIRWRHRAFFAVLALVGTLLAVGSHPWDNPSLLGSVFKAMSRTDAGLAMRSTPRAGPLVVLSLAVFLGVGVDALGRVRPRLASPVAIGVALATIVNLVPLWNGTMVAKNLQRDEDIPSYWNEAADYLQRRDDGTRVLELPGADFASYRWGNTVDPLTPGLMTRPYAARELFQWGSPPSADVLIALDHRLHENSMEADALAPMSRLLGGGDVVLRNDLEYERYRVARPREMWSLVRSAPGFDEPVGFGGTLVNVPPPDNALDDEIEQSLPPDRPWPPAVAVFGVQDPVPMVHAIDAREPLVVAGNGEGVVDGAGIDLIRPEQAVFYSGSLATDRAAFDRLLGQGADLLVTDTNRKRGRRWGTLRENTGYTERADEVMAYDPTDQRIELFPDESTDMQTVTESRVPPGAVAGVVATASAYGNPITFTPDDRPMNAVDDDPQSAWRVGAIAQVDGEFLELQLDRPVTTDHLRLLQPINLDRSRWLTKVQLTFSSPDGSSNETVVLSDASRSEPGQVVSFPSRTFTALRITLLDTNFGERNDFEGAGGVGFAEVRIPGVGAAEVVRPPTDLLAMAGTASLDHRLSLLFTRLRSNPSEPVRLDEEPSMVRVVNLPTARSFGISGWGRVSAYLTDPQIDRLLGLPDATNGGVTAQSDVRLPGDLRQRSTAAIDNNPATAWTSIYQNPVGHWVQFSAASPVTFDHLDTQIVADGHHSVPTSLTIMADGRAHTLTVPPLADDRPRNQPTPVRLDLPETVTARTITVTVNSIREVTTPEWYSGGRTVFPVSIAELGIDGLSAPEAPPTIDTGCRRDLLAIDGQPIGVRLQGTVDAALDKQRLAIEPCGPDAGVVDLSAGDHVIRTAIGRDVGIDLDQVLLSSERGGAALTSGAPGPEIAPRPATDVTVDGRLQTTVRTEASQPFWIVNGQSYADGWRARANGVDLGPPTLINAYTSGWLVTPDGSAPTTIVIDWTPQRMVWIALALSGIGVLACIGFIVFGRRRERTANPSRASHGAPVLAEVALPGRDRSGDVQPRIRSLRAVGLISGLVALFTLLNVPWGPLALSFALVAGATTWLVLRHPTTRGWVALAGAACLGVAGLVTVIAQYRFRYAPDFSWPTKVAWLHPLGLAAVFLLAISALGERWPTRADVDDGASVDS
jgi:arabinofuranan 3-O-arabinosyltransferase